MTATADKSRQRITAWLRLCCFMVFAMAVIGAVTRLTESGLSMTQWKPITGALPPLSQQAWEREFSLYRQSPEFLNKHYWMSLSDFQAIYFWEWLHRLWGRLIGLVYSLPLLYFFIRKQIPLGCGWKLSGILGLGALQGIVGWWMVASGLIDRPEVSHFRLAAHLLLALLIFSALLWTALDLRQEERPCRKQRPLALHGIISLAFLSVTIVWGAFTAGLDAGLVYNTFPLMNGHITPSDDKFDISKIIENQGWVQFTHRWVAITTGLLILTYSARVRRPALAFMVMIQIGLGITTLLLGVPILIAACHQAGAIILLALLLQSLHKTGYENKALSFKGCLAA